MSELGRIAERGFLHTERLVVSCRHGVTWNNHNRVAREVCVGDMLQLSRLGQDAALAVR